MFAGGATVEAAETITAGGLDTLDGLVTKSLLARRRHAHAPTRLGMLETIRAYAGERFAAAADAEAVREDHYRYYLALAERHGTERALRGAGAREHLARLDAEIDNLHAALGWAIAQPSAERALAMAAALGGYWVMRNRYADAVDWVDQALNLPGADAHPALRVRALRTKVQCLWQMGRGAEQPAVVAAAEAIARRLGDPVVLSQALQLRVDHEINAERLDVADAVADEALHWARAAGDEWEIAEASRGKAIAASSIADLRERVDTAASLLTDVGNVLDSRTSSPPRPTPRSASAASVTQRTLPRERLRSRARWTIRIERMINSGNLGLAALLTGDTDTASHAFREELTLCREMVVRPVVFEGLRGLAAVAVVHGDDKRAATLVGAADAHRYDKTEDPRRGQARRDVLRARPHTLRDRRMECRRARRQRAELRGRDRLRPRGTARVAPDPTANRSRNPYAFQAGPRSRWGHSPPSRAAPSAQRGNALGHQGRGGRAADPQDPSGQLLPGPLPLPVPRAEFEKVRDGGGVVNKALVIAHGAHETGRREILSIDVGAAETEAFWSRHEQPDVRTIADNVRQC